MTPRKIRVLIIEDSRMDAELTILELRRGDYEIECEIVETETQFVSALGHGHWDVILSDHNLPTFDSLQALRVLQVNRKDIPFIIVSGAIGEEVAVAAMKMGASDYVIKGSLARLAPAVERELREAEARRKRREAEQTLLLHQARLDGIIRSTMDAIISVNSDQRVVLFNRAAEQMFGYTSEEVLGAPLDMLLPERFRGRHRSHIQTFARTGTTSRTMGHLMTLAARRKGGEEFPIEATISQVRVAGQQIFTVIIRDVTARVRAEEQMAGALREKEMLLREVHHRVKNNLQVVSSLLALQAGKAQDPAAVQALEDSGGRIRAMTLVHEKLYGSQDISRVEFGEYLKSFVPELLRLHHAEATGVQVVIEAESVLLDVEKAVPLGLIANELITNSLKHAFHGRRRREVRIRASDRFDPGRPVLIVSDNGRGLKSAEIENLSSFGFRLVESLAAQLGCEVRWESANGTTVEIVAKEGA